MAPEIVTIRPGVQFAPSAARSFIKAEAALGRQIDVNSTYRDWNKQLSMYNAWNAYVTGRGPYPGHSRAIHPSVSVHCQGNALDSDDWTRKGFNEFMTDRGWIRTAANDPTERHHFEYQEWRDNHRNDPMPGKDEDMPVEDLYTRFGKTGGQRVKAGENVNLHINDAKDVTVAWGAAKHIAGNLAIAIEGGEPYAGAVQIKPVVRTYDGSKEINRVSLRAREIVFTGGDTLGEVAVNTKLAASQRLSFEIGASAYDFTVKSAVFRGMKIT